MNKTLYLSNLDGFYWVAQVDNGPLFNLDYYDVEDYTIQANIERIHYLDENMIDA